jgi:hypothetical protein
MSSHDSNKVESRLYGEVNNDLHKRFQCLSLLLTFFSAWESQGSNPTLDSTAVMKERMHRLSTKGETRVIDAALTILVRDNENLAGMSYLKPTDSPTRPPTSIAVTQVQDSDNGDIPTPPYESDESKSLTFAAIPNPGSNDNFPSQDKSSSLPFLINDGENHWDRILGDKDFMYTEL